LILFLNHIANYRRYGHASKEYNTLLIAPIYKKEDAIVKVCISMLDSGHKIYDMQWQSHEKENTAPEPTFDMA
jgi:hypothetical protein